MTFPQDTITLLATEPVGTSWNVVQAIRESVFVDEQGCPYEEEFDEFDATSHHVLLKLGSRPAGCARWRWIDARTAKLERFAVLPEARGKGLGSVLVRHVRGEAKSSGAERLVLHAQAHLENFYASFGFKTEGAPFVEAGIPHVKMWWSSPSSAASPPAPEA